MGTKIYTKTGDLGETGLLSGPRVGKDHPRVVILGELDELNSLLGVIRCEDLPVQALAIFRVIQHKLLQLGAELACPEPEKMGLKMISAEDVEILEIAIDDFTTALEPINTLILPGGVKVAAEIHYARAVCRRAERSLVMTIRECAERISPLTITWLNRLSDLLFILGRYINQLNHVTEETWSRKL